MKKLSKLYPGQEDILIRGIKMNSKEVEPGDLFICTMGVNADRHLFVDDAILHGAVAIVASQKIDVSVPVIYVEDTNRELARLMASFCNHPEEKMTLIGVTGTNGKTTVAKMVQDLLGDDLCGYIGTNGVSCADYQQSIRNTTPDVDRLYPYLETLVEKGCKFISLETSSEAFYRHRLDSFSFDVSIFTNVQEDHLNIHKTMENYVSCKCDLVRKTKKDGFCILNQDDAYYETFAQCATGKVLTYGKTSKSDLYIKNITLSATKTDISFSYGGVEYQVESPFLGEYNVYNLCAALLASVSLGKTMEELLEKVPSLSFVLGRLEQLSFGQEYQIILDYAHTKDALDATLDFLNRIKKGKIITVTGSAGGREKEKRPQMGQVVLEKSDYVIFTMDDPREEDVNQIIDDMVGESTLTHYERIVERPLAIRKALQMARPEDIVFITGKGRDNYMALGKEYVPYSDFEEIEKYFSLEN